jgi:hypothetical protein
MDLRWWEKDFCLVLPEPCVEISGTHVEPDRIECCFVDDCVKIWDRWRIQVMYQATDVNGAAVEKRFQETVLWEERFPVAWPAGQPVYQTLPYCVKIAVSKGAEGGSRLTLSVVTVTAFEPGKEKSSEDLVGSALRRLGLAESVRL